MSKTLIFWVVFWPGLLLSLLLNAIRAHYAIQDARPLMVGFGLYISLCALGILLGVKWLTK